MPKFLFRGSWSVPEFTLEVPSNRVRPQPFFCRRPQTGGQETRKDQRQVPVTVDVRVAAEVRCSFEEPKPVQQIRKMSAKVTVVSRESLVSPLAVQQDFDAGVMCQPH